jgi:hypothetical protein
MHDQDISLSSSGNNRQTVFDLTDQDRLVALGESILVAGTA